MIWEDIFVAYGIASNRSSPYDIGMDDTADKRQLIITRAIATLIGVVSVGFAALAPSLQGILELANASMAVLAGPLLATFLLGFFTSTSNKIVSMLLCNGTSSHFCLLKHTLKGAICGILVGDAACLWLMIGSYVWKPDGDSNALPTYDVGCQMSRNATLGLDVANVVHNQADVKSTFFYIPKGWVSFNI